jgi:pimeloyl-ACP methyl ester carboxylesterase
VDWEGLSNVILVGHSYGGCVITGVADRVGDRLRHLFYLDGFVPDGGERLFDLRPPEDNVIMHQLVNEFGGGWNMSPLTAEIFNVNPKDSEWFDKKCTSQAIATFDEPIRLTNGQFPVHKVTYVHASNWDFKPHTGRSYEKAKSRGWETHVIDCGHAVMLDRPETLNGWLLRLGEP